MHADKHESFHKIAFFFFMKVARHVQSTQDRKLVIFLQYLKKKSLMKFGFLHSDRDESFLQVNTGHFICVWRPDLVKVPIIYLIGLASCRFLCQTLLKELIISQKLLLHV